MAHSSTRSSKLSLSTLGVALMTLLSRLLGFLRDLVFANLFGAGVAFDAFVIAFRLPNFFRRLFAEGAFSQAFIPVLSTYSAEQDPDRLRDFLSNMYGVLGFILLIVVTIGVVAAPLVLLIIAPGYLAYPAQFATTAHMIRLLFPYLMLVSLAAFATATLNTFSRFVMPALAPIVFNLVLIIGSALWVVKTKAPLSALAIMVLVGGLFQWLVQWPILARLQLLVLPRFGWRHPGVRRVLRLMLPALLGVSVAQLSLLIDNAFASFLVQGSISWLYYSDRLVYLPQGVIGVALATVVLPHLSHNVAQKNTAAYADTLNWALRIVFLFSMPAGVGLALCAAPIIATLFLHGAFGVHDLEMTVRSLRLFCVGMPAFMLIKILAVAFYARQQIKTPVKIAIIASAVGVVLNALLIGPLAHAGLALATSMACWVNAMGLFYRLWQQGDYQWSRTTWQFIARVCVASAVMAVYLLWAVGSAAHWSAHPLLWRVAHLAGIIISALLGYFVILWLCGVRRSDLVRDGESFCN